MDGGIITPRYSEEAAPPAPWKEKLRQGLKVTGLVLLVVLVAIPVVAIASAFLFWPDLDRQIKDAAARAEVIEPPEFDGRAYSMYTRKLVAVATTLEPEPFVTLTVGELNSALNNLINTGMIPQSLPILRLEADKDLLRPRVLWTGPQFAGLLTACGLSPQSVIYGPVVGYMPQLQYVQLDVWLRPRVERGLLTWNIERATADGLWCPTSFAEWLQGRILPRGAWFTLGPANRAIKECRMTDQGLLLKWTAPRR